MKKGVPVNKEAMSTSRVAEADAMAVDEAGGVAPSREWMQAAQRALETDGILDGSPAKRHKVCICICTLMSQHTCTPKLLGESLSEDVQVRVSREYRSLERIPLLSKKSSLLKKGPLRISPEALPKPSGTGVSVSLFRIVLQWRRALSLSCVPAHGRPTTW